MAVKDLDICEKYYCRNAKNRGLGDFHIGSAFFYFSTFALVSWVRSKPSDIKTDSIHQIRFLPQPQKNHQHFAELSKKICNLPSAPVFLGFLFGFWQENCLHCLSNNTIINEKIQRRTLSSPAAVQQKSERYGAHRMFVDERQILN